MMWPKFAGDNLLQQYFLQSSEPQVSISRLQISHFKKKVIVCFKDGQVLILYYGNGNAKQNVDVFVN